jgi:hypothetical protein
VSYLLADTTGVLEEFASIGGMRDFSSWALNQTPTIRRFVSIGVTEDLDNLRTELASVEPTALVREQYEALKKAEDILIITDGMSDEDFRSAGGPGSGNHGHAGRPGEVGGSAPSVSGAIDYESWTAGMHEKTASVFREQAKNLHEQSFGDPNNVHETLTFINTAKAEPFIKTPLKGGADFVDVDLYTRTALFSHPNPSEIVAIHTHPSSSSFSPEDFNQILEGKFGGGVVVGKDGTIYEMRVNRRMQPYEERDLKDDLSLSLAEARMNALHDTDKYVEKTYGVKVSRFGRAEMIKSYPEIEQQHSKHWAEASNRAWSDVASSSNGLLSYRRVSPKAKS